MEKNMTPTILSFLDLAALAAIVEYENLHQKAPQQRQLRDLINAWLAARAIPRFYALPVSSNATITQIISALRKAEFLPAQKNTTYHATDLGKSIIARLDPDWRQWFLSAQWDGKDFFNVVCRLDIFFA